MDCSCYSLTQIVDLRLAGFYIGHDDGFWKSLGTLVKDA